MRRSVAPAAALAVMVLVVGQIAASAHAAQVRHVICDTHGEELEAPTAERLDDNCGQSHLIAVEGGSEEHADCAITRALRQTIEAPGAPLLVVTTASIRVADAPLPDSVVIARTLVLIAPKTSPPA